MMDSKIYDLIFILSTDYFSEYLFLSERQKDRNTIKQIARNLLEIILNGGDDYYACLNYGEGAINEANKLFYKEIELSSLSITTLDKIKYYHRNLSEKEKISDTESAAEMVIVTKAANLYWFDIDMIKTEISEALLEIATIVQPYGIDTEELPCNEDDWIESASSWDKYLMSLMDDDLAYLPFVMFSSIFTHKTYFTFLEVWKKHLSDEQYETLISFLIKESTLELEQYNPNASKEIFNILKFWGA